MTNKYSTDLSDEFFRVLIGVSQRLEADPVHLLKVMQSESGINPKAKNPTADANGLIQFMGNTLKNLGWKLGGEAFRKLSAEEQLPFVEKYYTSWKPYGLGSPARLYLATFLPALMVHKGSHSEGFVLCGLNGPLRWAYLANKVFDQEKKGTITLGDLGKAIDRSCKGQRWNEIITRLLSAQHEADEIEKQVTCPEKIT